MCEKHLLGRNSIHSMNTIHLSYIFEDKLKIGGFNAVCDTLSSKEKLNLNNLGLSLISFLTASKKYKKWS